MIRKAETLAMAVLLVAVYSSSGLGQAVPPTILQIQVENQVAYFEDTSDLSKFATDQGVTTANPPRNFGNVVVIGDIVAVNGQPAKGFLLSNLRLVTLRTAPAAGQAIADTIGEGIIDGKVVILNSDLTPIGTIISSGPFGPPPPGAPLAVTLGNSAIVGGTGAFLGARGYLGSVTTVPARLASMTEDPANRRRNGGGRGLLVLQVIPLFRPEIVATPLGPAVVHANDFSLVTAAKPAKAGETLALIATGLGPTKPGVDPGKPFPASPLAVANSPVAVTINGAQTQVLYAGGFPGAVDAYQVNFTLPPNVQPGLASLQVTAAFITGPEVKIAIQ